MGILRSLFEQRSAEKPAVPLTSASLLALFEGTQTATGKLVSETSAMQTSAVFACVRVRAETVASLPWPVYRRLAGGGKERDPEHPLYELLHDLPNPEQTAMEFRENLIGHLDLRGNAYAEIEWGGDGRPRALWPLRPDRVSEERRDGKLFYVVTLPDGTRRGLPAYRVWHTRGFMGLSVIGQAREAVGLALAGEEYGARFFSNDSRPGGVLKSPKALTPQAARNLKESWEAASAGLSNRHRMMVLEEGLEWQQVGLAPEDSQYLQLREFQVTDIARFFRVPPHKIADLRRATFSNIEHQSIEFVVDCIRPICVRLEQSARRCLFTAAERRTWFAEHVIDGLLRGDIKSRYEAYNIGRLGGWLCADDILEKENMNPLPDGQGRVYLIPSNMTPAGQAEGEPPATSAGTDEEAENRARRGLQRLIVDAMERVIRREEADVMRQARRLEPARLLSWLDGFYREHTTFMLRALDPLVEAIPDLGGQLPQDPAQVAIEYADTNLAELRGLIAEGGDLVARLQERFDAWREARPLEIAEQLSRKGGRDVSFA